MPYHGLMRNEIFDQQGARVIDFSQVVRDYDLVNLAAGRFRKKPSEVTSADCALWLVQMDPFGEIRRLSPELGISSDWYVIRDLD
jgi:hypothetical protein